MDSTLLRRNGFMYSDDLPPRLPALHSTRSPPFDFLAEARVISSRGNSAKRKEAVPMPDRDTLSGWGDRDKVAWFIENADSIIPRRREQLRLLADLIPSPREAEIAVLDLGAGFGAVTDELLLYYAKASVTCVDGSAEMVNIARDRMAKYGARVRVFHADLADGTWPRALDRSFDAAVSALAIHHLSDERKRAFYSEVYALLRPGGVFLNNDLVAAPPAFKAQFEELNLLTIQEQERLKRGKARPLQEIRAEMRAQLEAAGPQHDSLIAALSDQLQWLREAGFKSVDCYWKYLEFAIFGGVKE
jgi:tRNA (cmo5U34)-methyltransferase